MRHLVGPLAGILAFSACTTLIGQDFQGYVAQPTECNPASPQGGSPRQFVACADDQTCIVGLQPDGSIDNNDTTQAACFNVDKSLEPGATCIYANDCGPGALCTNELGCASYCTVGGSDCPSGVPCVPNSPPPWSSRDRSSASVSRPATRATRARVLGRARSQ